MTSPLKQLALTLFSAVIFSSTTSAQSDEKNPKFATVNMETLFKNYHRTDQQQQAFSEKFAEIQQENNTRLTNIRALEKDLQKLQKEIEDPILAASVRQKKTQMFRSKLETTRAMHRELKEFIGRRTRALEIHKQQSMSKLLEQIQTHIIDYAKAENYDYVFDKSAISTNRIPFLIYAKDVVDITPQLLQRINKDAPVKKLTKSTPPIR